MALLGRLIHKGDVIAIEQGRLVIAPQSGKPVPSEWLNINKDALIESIVLLVKVDAFRYCSYSTGRYNPHKSGGLTLQFEALLSDTSPYVIFNANLKRQKTTKNGSAGSPLPKGRFRVTKKTHFYKFWGRTGLPFPRRLSSFYDYMGNLKQIVYTGSYSKPARLDAGSLMPLEVSYQAIVEATNRPDNSRTNAGLLPNNIRTSVPDKEFPLRHTAQGLQENLTAGENYCGKKVNVNEEKREKVILLPVTPRNSQQQSTEEWLADYSK